MLIAQALHSSIHVFRATSELFDPWEVVFDDISLHRIIGEGAFGKVYSGELLKQTMEIGKGRKSSQRKKDKEQQQMKRGPIVAVKMLQSKISLLSECFIENSTSLTTLTFKESVLVFFIMMLDQSKHRITLG